MVVVLSKGGVQYARNIQDVKKATNIENNDKNVPSTDDLLNTLPDTEGLFILPEKSMSFSSLEIEDIPGTKITTTNETSRRLRYRKDIQKPVRFDKNFVYNVFH